MKFSSTQQETFEKFVDLFFQENEKANLTGCDDRDVFWRKHIVDSAMLDHFVKFHAGQRVADIGCGGGLPGLVLAVLHPQAHFVLIDSHRKKTEACDFFAKELGLTNVTVKCARVEDIGRDAEYRETFDWAVSRAVAKLSVLLEYSLPLVTIGGWFVSYKGPDPTEELQGARWPLKALGGRMDAAKRFELPEGDDRRTLVFVEKIAKTTSVFPRRNGVPRKRPIGEEDAKRAIQDRMDEAYAEAGPEKAPPGNRKGQGGGRGRSGGPGRDAGRSRGGRPQGKRRDDRFSEGSSSSSRGQGSGSRSHRPRSGSGSSSSGSSSGSSRGSGRPDSGRNGGSGRGRRGSSGTAPVG